MSARATRPFLADLRRLEHELATPVEDRLRFLRELEYDLECHFEGLLARGVSAEEARRLALEALVPDGEALAALGRLHRPLYRRVTASFDSDRLRRWERGALVLLGAGVVVVQGTVLLRADLLRDPSPFLLPVLVLGALLTVVCAARIFELFVKRDPRALERRHDALLALCAGLLVTAFAGVLVDTYRMAATLQHAPPGTGASVVPGWLIRECALVGVAVLLALAGGLVWFLLTQWTSGVASARREVLALDPSLDPSPDFKETFS